MVVRDAAEPGLASRCSSCGAPPARRSPPGCTCSPAVVSTISTVPASWSRSATGLDDAAASRLLGLERGGLAYWVAAIRECFEESGPAARPPPRRNAVADAACGRRSRGGARRCAVDARAVPPRRAWCSTPAALRYVAHWVTPAEERARRFDTRFFLTPRAKPTTTGVHDEVETIDSVWLAPAEAMRRAMAGEMTLMPPDDRRPAATRRMRHRSPTRWPRPTRSATRRGSSRGSSSMPPVASSGRPSATGSCR